MTEIRQLWNGAWGIYNSAGIMVSIPYVRKEAAENALARIKKHNREEKGDLF